MQLFGSFLVGVRLPQDLFKKIRLIMYGINQTSDFFWCFLRRAILLHTLALYFAKEWPCSFLFVVFGNAPIFPALLQFSLNTTVIGLISYLRPGSGRREGGVGYKQW